MKSSVSPTAKALRALNLLHLRPGITANELAERLGVTDRAARRYIAILREADITVESTTGPYGGYQLGHGVTTHPIFFTADETLSLVMAALDGHHSAANIDEPVGSALDKLLRILPEQVGQQAAMMRDHARVAPDRRAARPDPHIAAKLIDAIAKKLGIRIGYRSESGSRSETTADPWAIVVRHGRWYLLCFAHFVAAIRAYRIDRIEQLDILDVDITIPTDLDPVAVLEQHLGDGWKHKTHVEFDAPIADVARYITPSTGQLQPINNNRCELHGSTSNPVMYASERLALVPYAFRVIDPPELREAVAELARRLTAATRPAKHR